MKYIDLHSHITWDVDDGIQTKEETLKAIEIAKKDGINQIVLTPHFIPGRFRQNDFIEITENMKKCVKCCEENGIQAYFGSEIFLNEDYLTMFDQQMFYSINQSKYVLVEFDVRREMNNNDSAEEKLYEILIRGYVPIIAHVERYFHETLDIKRVKKWKEMGCLIQINRTSLLGKKHLVHNVTQLIENNLVHFIATDAHAASGNRISILSDCYTFIQKKYGDEVADLLCRINPQHVLRNEEVEETKIQIKKSLINKLFKRR